MTHFLEANPLVVFREDPEGGGILFDPETGAGFRLNAVGVFVWRHLDGFHTIDDIVEAMERAFSDVPPDARSHVEQLVQTLLDKGLVGRVLRQG